VYAAEVVLEAVELLDWEYIPVVALPVLVLDKVFVAVVVLVLEAVWFAYALVVVLLLVSLLVSA
jgi:hypothetical protein